MTYKTHLVGGAVAAMLLTLAASEQELGLKPFTTPEFFGVLTASLLGSLAPDIDQGKKSKAGAMVKPVASVCSKCFGHRTFCHSVWFLLLLYFIIRGIFPSMAFFGLAFCIGGASHLLLDCFNPRGVRLFWPIPLTFHFGNVKTASGRGSMLENWFWWTPIGVPPRLEEFDYGYEHKT